MAQYPVSLFPPMAPAMMTLAQLAAVAPDERPSGELLVNWQNRILTGINELLLDTNLATAGEWVVLWVGLSQDGANLSFIAQCPTQNAFAVSIRGTQFNSLTDLGEDLEPGTVAQFSPDGSTPLLVSQGSMKAFIEITSTINESSRTTLLQALTPLINAAPTTLYVTGHSLGGAITTMVALYLAAQNWVNKPTLNVFTFAAPSAGLQDFANYYDAQLTNQLPNQTWRIYNAYDLVPNAWASMSNAENTLYPNPPGPAQNDVVSGLLKNFAQLPNNNVYVQTNQNSSTAIELNTNYTSQAIPPYVLPTVGDFMAQVAFQHNSYLQLLGAQTLPAAGETNGPPTVTAISPNFASAGDTITITGAGFISGSVVDFGTVPALLVTIVSDTEITAMAPAIAGVADVRVTNQFGTSAVTPADQYAGFIPTSVPTLMPISPFSPEASLQSAVSPISGPADGGTVVTISGTGFTTGSTVLFGSTPATSVTVVSLTKILAVSPAGSGTVSVSVTNSVGQSAATTPPTQFTYGPPVVTALAPTGGVTATSVTVSGYGFTSTSVVKFGDQTASITAPLSGTDPQTIVVAAPTAPKIAGKDTPKPVSVTVSNGSEISDPNTQVSQFTYF